MSSGAGTTLPIIDAAADLLIGGRCPGCARPQWRVCSDCVAEVAAGIVGAVLREPVPPDFPVTVAAGEYAGALSRLLTAYKEDQVHSLAGLLGQRVGLAAGLLLHHGSMAGALRGPIALVPIPSSPQTVRRRGLDCTAVLARRAAGELKRLLGVRVPVHQVLRHRHRVADQAGLDTEERRANLAGALQVTAVRPVSAVILVDDVTTTGATLAEANRVLTAAGMPVLGAATVAATRLRRHLNGPVADGAAIAQRRSREGTVDDSAR